MGGKNVLFIPRSDQPLSNNGILWRWYTNRSVNLTSKSTLRHPKKMDFAIDTISECLGNAEINQGIKK